MVEVVKAACVQMTSGPDIEGNLRAAEKLIRAAAGEGAKLIATPENTDCIRTPPSEKLKCAFAETDHPGIKIFSGLAAELKIALLAGSFAIKLPEGKIANRSYLFSDQGKIAAQYDKIHLFDVDLPTGEKHRESETIKPGEKPVVAETPMGVIGLSICYDLRFAYLYRALAKARAQILTIPAAFTVPTGKAHWEVLLRARAIETGSFVLAPAQTGTHEGGRKTWGHSMIISPWGEILAQMNDETGFVTADLNLDDVAKARAAIPALKHDREVNF